MAQVGFSEAQSRVRLAEEARWEAEEFGEFWIAPYGAENATHWLVIYGAREALVDGDPMFSRIDAPITLVSKATGAISHLPYMANMAVLDAMTDVGEYPTA
jgi:hypothetical protein